MRYSDKMKKPITLPLPTCSKCNKILEPQFTTEKEEGDDAKPEIIMMFGRCDKCQVITVCNIIKIKDIPNLKDIEKLLKKVKKKK